MLSSPSPSPFGGDAACKRNRRPAGTPDPDAEVVSLSPRTLLESDRYVCEICGQGFQRDQNLQMHRRRHKVPWKLLKREIGVEVRKRVFVCPESSCLHHDPSHALGDLVGIKKHYRRKHGSNRQWVCEKCSKAYAVQSDYKAHLKTCGSRGHSCDCGRVFSRVESFIQHQDSCNAGRARTKRQVPQPPCLSRTASSPSPFSDFSTALAWRMPTDNHRRSTVELQLLPLSSTPAPAFPSTSDDRHITTLQLSLGPNTTHDLFTDGVREQLRLAAAEKSLADEARVQAKKHKEMAEQELAGAKMIRQQAQAELSRALAMREHAAKRVSLMLVEITCQSCKQLFHAKAAPAPADEQSLAASYVSSVVTEGDGEDDDQYHQQLTATYT